MKTLISDDLNYIVLLPNTHPNDGNGFGQNWGRNNV